MVVEFLSYFPAIIGVLSIGLFVYLNNPNYRRNQLFALANASIALWLLNLFLADMALSPHLALLLFQFGLFFGAVMVGFLYLFALAYPYDSKISRIGQVLSLLPLLFIALASFTPLTVTSVRVEQGGIQPVDVGLFYTLSDVVVVFYVAACVAVLLSKYKRADSQQRSQIRMMLIGLTIAIAANVFSNMILTILRIDSDYSYVGSLSLFIFSLLVGYAMVRYKFFEIRPVVARLAVYIGSLFLLGLLCVTPIVLIIGYFLDYHPTPVRLFLVVVSSTALSYGLQYMRTIFDKATAKVFYKDYYDPQEVLEKLANILVHTVGVDMLISKCTRLVADIMHTHLVKYVLAGSQDIHERRIVREIQAYSRANLVATNDAAGESSRIIKTLHDQRIAAAVKLRTKHEELGYMLLGYKLSGELYTAQDRRLLSTMADEIALSLQNALRFEEIERFNETLQQRVDDATRQLRHANKRLKALNESKDDFIGMTSHQLRTPLTSIKGYISLVMDGDAGKITETQRELLQQAFTSSQKMVYLIADLLNVSRLKTGKFVVERTPTNLARLIEDEMDQLQEEAKTRGLELTFKAPKDFPVLPLDETKTRQVIMNFMDNAIYYTPSGGHIRVELEELPRSVEFRVIDDGIGVPRAEMPHLFSKFYRAKNAQRTRPDGTGLGLYMAQKVVVAQGGAIIFSSKEGEGSTFGFSFPKDLPTENVALPMQISD